MIGHRRPVTTLLWIAALAWAATALRSAPATHAAEVRLRIAWGSGAQAPQRWTGEVSVDSGRLEQLQPLGIEADEAAAVRLIDNRVVVNPLVPRAFDGCDITLHAEPHAVVTVRLHSASSPAAKVVQATLRELASATISRPLDEVGGYLLVQRAPGDRLRVRLQRDHLVFAPTEMFPLTVVSDLGPEYADATVALEARLRRAGASEVLWQSNYTISPGAADVAMELRTPPGEGAYRLTLTARRPPGLVNKLVPWEQGSTIAARDVEFVVIDPNARLPRFTPRWDTVQTIDPASPKSWLRAPEWTQLDRLAPAGQQRALGNVKPLVRPGGSGGFVELPTPAAGSEPTWQAYPLTIRDVDQPHALEVAVPPDAVQNLAVCIIEPDAAGRVLTFGREAALYNDDATPTDAAPSRIVFWPRTSTPWVLLVNHSAHRPAEYGVIRVLRRATEDAPPASLETSAEAARMVHPRLAAVYLGSPRLADSTGAARQLDGAGSGALSVDGWNTFLEAGRRLAQQVRAAGYNGAVVTVAADGASLAAVPALGSAPRYDTGLLAGSGADPVRKDVLEAWLRIFNREGLKLVPAIELAAPLPLAELVLTEDAAACLGSDGRRWEQRPPGDVAGPRYNLLHPPVQQALHQTVDDLVARYAHHSALGGVAIDVSSQGYGALPGAQWNLDDATISRFAAEVGLDLPTEGDDRFARRAALVAGAHSGAWKSWRTGQVAGFYAAMAAQMRQRQRTLQLVLCTENLFASAAASQRLRQAVGGRTSLDDAAADLGVSFTALAANEGLCVLRPRRLGSDDSVAARALDWQINGAAEIDQALAAHPASGELLYRTSRRLRLASFDAVSPWGSDKTRLATQAPAFPSGAAANRSFASALAGRDFFTLVEGSELLPLVEHEASVLARRVFQQLPGGDAEVRIEKRQPITLRIYRTAAAATVCLINESPWPVAVELPIDHAESVAWRDLGLPDDAGGSLEPGAAPWRTTIGPYGLAARRYDNRNVRVGALTTSLGAGPAAALAARISDVEGRMKGMDIERPYPQLQNANFELVGADQKMLGWQPLVGAAGSVAVDDAAAAAGSRSLRLRSDDALGVAAQSLRFPIPATGQLVVRAQVRTPHRAGAPRLYVWVEYDQPGGTVRQPKPLDGVRADGQWHKCEATFDDLPLASGDQMRVQLHLAGPGQAWVDAVEMFDLRFPDAQRNELVKRVFAARTALDEGRLVDCQRQLDGYWPRYLVENVPAGLTAEPVAPPERPAASLAARPAEAPSAPPEGEGGLGDRVRRFVPRVWR